MTESTPRIVTPTVRAHRRQVFWQILLPMIVIVLVGFAAGALVIAASFSGAGNARLWADVALIWLLAPMLFLAFGLAAALFALVYGLARLSGILPEYTGQAQQLSLAGLAWVRRLADALVRPVMWLRQAVAVLGWFGKRTK